jgi:hypothetical protein
VAQWIRHRPTEPGIAGSSPAGVIYSSCASTVWARFANDGSICNASLVMMICTAAKMQCAGEQTCDTVSEWLRRWTRNPLGSARRGSNPLGVGDSACVVSFGQNISLRACCFGGRAGYPQKRFTWFSSVFCILIMHADWVHSSVVRAADCRSAGPWFKSGCALFRPM